MGEANDDVVEVLLHLKDLCLLMKVEHLLLPSVVGLDRFRIHCQLLLSQAKEAVAVLDRNPLQRVDRFKAILRGKNLLSVLIQQAI